MGFWALIQEDWMQGWSEGHREGVASLVRGSVLGTGGIQIIGDYLPTDGNERKYNVKIVTSGSVGSAQFIWNDGAGWSTLITTSSSPIPLSHGLSVIFLAGNYFAGDEWTFDGVLPFGWEKAWDGNRRVALESRLNITNLTVYLQFSSAVSLTALAMARLENIGSLEILSGPDAFSLQSIKTDSVQESQEQLAIFFAPQASQPVYAFRFFPVNWQVRMRIGEMRCGQAFLIDWHSLHNPIFAEEQREATPDYFTVFREADQIQVELGMMTESEMEELVDYLSRLSQGGRNYGCVFGWKDEEESRTEDFWMGYWISPVHYARFAPKPFQKSGYMKWRLKEYPGRRM